MDSDSKAHCPICEVDVPIKDRTEAGKAFKEFIRATHADKYYNHINFEKDFTEAYLREVKDIRSSYANW